MHRALSAPDEERDALDWYEGLRDSLSIRLFEQSEILAGYDWSPEEASARMRVTSDEVRAECETLVALPAWDASPALVA